KFFLYGAYEFDNLGQQATAPTGLAPTSAGMTMLTALSANSQVRNVLTQFPLAPVQTATLTVSGQQVPIGRVNSIAPSFANQHNFIINGDWNVDERQSLHVRYLQTRTRQPSFGVFPQQQFGSLAAVGNHRVILNHVWTATPRLVNDFRISFSRVTQFT